MNIQISTDKKTATIDGVEYELQQKGKKISEWLNELPDGYRELALANFNEQGNENINVDTMVFALQDAFSWEKSNESYEFWYDVCDYIEMNILTMPPLPKPKFEVWKPKEGEQVYFVNLSGQITETQVLKPNISLYRFYKTKEQAIEAHEKAMFNYEVEMFIKEKNEGWVPDYNDSSNNKYRIVYDVSLKRLSIESSNSRKHVSDEKVLKTFEIGEEIIAKFDNEKLVKYWI